MSVTRPRHVPQANSSSSTLEVPSRTARRSPLATRAGTWRPSSRWRSRSRCTRRRACALRSRSNPRTGSVPTTRPAWWCRSGFAPRSTSGRPASSSSSSSLAGPSSERTSRTRRSPPWRPRGSPPRRCTPACASGRSACPRRREHPESPRDAPSGRSESAPRRSARLPPSRLAPARDTPCGPQAHVRLLISMLAPADARPSAAELLLKSCFRPADDTVERRRLEVLAAPASPLTPLHPSPWTPPPPHPTRLPPSFRTRPAARRATCGSCARYRS